MTRKLLPLQYFVFRTYFMTQKLPLCDHLRVAGFLSSRKAWTKYFDTFKFIGSGGRGDVKCEILYHCVDLERTHKTITKCFWYRSVEFRFYFSLSSDGELLSLLSSWIYYNFVILNRMRRKVERPAPACLWMRRVGKDTIERIFALCPSGSRS